MDDDDCPSGATIVWLFIFTFIIGLVVAFVLTLMIIKNNPEILHYVPSEFIYR